MDKLVFILALLMSLVHLFAYRVKLLNQTPRSIWLSIAGGISVAYIFMHLLPELARGHEVVAGDSAIPDQLEHPLYLLALVGLCLFYGLERYVKINKHRKSGEKENGVFWPHVIIFSLYNLLIGYIFVNREDESSANLIFFFVALALHFFVNDYGLIEHYKEVYIKKGRWILSASVLLGWLVGVLVVVPEIYILSIMAFLAGGIIMNVLKEELPEEKESRYWAFIGGAISYTVLLLLSV